MIAVKVPATTANLGPGFDSLGAALGLYNVFHVEKTNGCKEFHWGTGSPGVSERDNLVLRTMDHVFRHFRFSCQGFRVESHRCCIPMNRGLGSSASAVAAGVLAANYLMDGSLPAETMQRLAVEMEGHPDNVIACMLGGVRVSVVDAQGGVTTGAVAVHPSLQFVIVIPNTELSTARARAVLPETYTRGDLVPSVSRTALLLSALANGHTGQLRLALDDRAHQPYRLPLIPAAQEVMDICRDVGSYGEFVSGAGPSIVALTSNAAKGFAPTLQRRLDSSGLHWKVLPLSLCWQGASMEVM